MLEVIIIDDEMNARAALKGILEENFADRITVVAEASNLPEGVKAIQKHRPNLVFLDVEMPGYTGLELPSFLPPEELDFHIIFVTAYTEYAIKAFELSAIDYILKPIHVQHLARAIDKAEKQVVNANISQIEAARLTMSNPAEAKVALPQNEGLLMVKLDEILYLKADGSYTSVNLANGQSLVVSKKLLEFEKLQDIGNFMRVQRSYVVNLNKVRKYLKIDGGVLVMENGFEITVSGDKKQELTDRLAHIRI